MKEKFDLLIGDWVDERVDNERTQTRINFMFDNYKGKMPRHMVDALLDIQSKITPREEVVVEPEPRPEKPKPNMRLQELLKEYTSQLKGITGETQTDT